MKKFRLSVAIIMIGTLISKIFGLTREVLLAQKYGTGYISDSFIVSLNIPTVLISAIASAVLTNYIPLFSKAEKKSKEEAESFSGTLLNISLIFSIIIIGIFFIFTKPIVNIFAVGFDEVGLSYLINLSRITIFCMFFIIASRVFKGYLEYRGKFVATAIEGILMNLGMIAGIVFSSSERYQALGYGVLCGYILSFLALMITALKNGFKIKRNINLKDKYLKELIILTIPILLNDVVWQINGVVDKSVASIVGEGYISAINYSHYIVDMIASVFATSIVTVLFPNIVKLFQTKGIEAVKEKTRSVLNTILLISIPCTALIILYAKPIIKVLFFRGEFNINSLNITSVAVSIYSIALTFVCLKTILFKVFYAMQDTKSPTKSAVVAILGNIILTIILVKPFGYKGIIIATIISSIISTIMLFNMFRRKFGTLINKDFIYSNIKVIVSTILMLVLVSLINKYTSTIYIYSNFISNIIYMVIGGISAIIIYVITLILIKYKFVFNKSKEEL